MPKTLERHNTAIKSRPASAQNAEFRKALLIPEKAFLVSPAVRQSLNSHPRQQESIALVRALGLEVARAQKVTLRHVHPGNYLLSGVLDRLKEYLDEDHPDLMVIDCSLSPVQQRNLERLLNRRVIDRHGLILEIFAKRARSHEGRLQVELAHLRYQESRLVRSWTHLERQRGGLGKVGGPGESQLEIDRRLLRQQIHIRERKIIALEGRRGLQRQNRKKSGQRSVALVGYTNAGKTTLFNLLCGAQQQADNRVFETLDTTMRRWTIAPGTQVVLSDTVGFIDDLPPDLIHAFRATLEEVLFADVILHLHDYHAPEHHRDVVQEIIADILAQLPEDERPPVICVYNKCENLAPNVLDALGREGIIAISGQYQQNIDGLSAQIHALLEGNSRLLRFGLKGDAGQVLEWLYQNGKVENCDYTADSINLCVRLSQEKQQGFWAQVEHANWQEYLIGDQEN